MGVPVKPMNDALGNASRICRARPSMRCILNAVRLYVVAEKVENRLASWISILLNPSVAISTEAETWVVCKLVEGHLFRRSDLNLESSVGRTQNNGTIR